MSGADGCQDDRDQHRENEENARRKSTWKSAERARGKEGVDANPPEKSRQEISRPDYKIVLETKPKEENSEDRSSEMEDVASVRKGIFSRTAKSLQIRWLIAVKAPLTSN